MAARSLSLRQIEVFRAVMSGGSMTAAANNLHVSQPLISQVLKSTEDQLGFKLFSRSRGRLQSTRQADTLYAETMHLEAALERLQCTADGLRRQSEGIVNLLISPSLALSLLTPTLKRYRRKWPGIHIFCEPLGYRELVPRLQRGEADVGVALGAEDEPGLDTLKVGRVRLVCALPSQHRLAGSEAITPQDLKGETLIAFPEESAVNRAIVSAFHEAGVSFVPAINVPFGLTALDLVRGGLGVAIVDGLTASNRSDGLVLRDFLPMRTLDAALLFTEEKKGLRPIGDLIDALRSEARSQVGWKR